MTPSKLITFSRQLWSLYRAAPAAFFAPYATVYAVFWAVDASTVSVLWLFQGLHVFHLITGVLALQKPNKASRESLIFWGLLALLFWFPGAYLEYPSDPWEHARRLFVWNTYPSIRSHPFHERLSYFWNWSVLQSFPVGSRRLGLDLCSTFWQLVLALQFSRLIKTLGFEKRWVFIQVLAFVVLFGTNLFSFSRYYALSATPLGYAAYLAALQILVGQKRDVPGFLIFTALAAMNHPQCLLFLALSGCAFLLYKFWPEIKKFSLAQPKYILGLHVFLWVLAFCLLYFFPQILPAKFKAGEISKIGTFRVISRHSRFFETWGLPGLLGLLAAFYYRRKIPLLSLLTIIPLWAVIFPPFVFLMAQKSHVDTPYRILYAFPCSVALVYGLREIIKKIQPKRELTFVTLALLILSAPYFYPWRGRLFSTLNKPEPARTLSHVDETATWFSKNRVLNPHCWLITDDATAFALDTFLGRENFTYNRMPPLLFTRRWRRGRIDVEGALGPISQNTARPVCGILVADVQKVPKPGPSRISRSSEHWPEEWGDPSWIVDPDLRDRIRFLETQGWKKTPVPPFYDLFEPPSAPHYPAGPFPTIQGSG